MEKKEVSISKKLVNIYLNFARKMNALYHHILQDSNPIIDKAKKEIVKRNNNLEKLKTSIDKGAKDELFLLLIQLKKNCESEIKACAYNVEYQRKNVIIECVTAYETLFVDLMRFIVNHKKVLLPLLNQSLDFIDLKDCNTREEIEETYINKFFEEFMQKKYADQIEWLKNKQKIDLKSDVELYKKYALIKELRNLYVHNDGKINKSFINKMSDYKIDSEVYLKDFRERVISCKVFEKINTVEHWAFNTFMEILNKYFVKDNEIYYSVLNDVNEYALYMIKFRPEMSKIYFQYILNNCKLTSEYYFMFTLNKCIALKKMHESFKEELNSLDWSNCLNIYIFAKYILEEKYDEALVMMSKLDDNFTYDCYYHWPIFEDFIKIEGFKKKFKSIYGEDFCEEGIETYVEQEINKLALKEKDQKIIKTVVCNNSEEIEETQEESKESKNESDDKGQDSEDK